MFPAHAGMTRRWATASRPTYSVPRPRGDDPALLWIGSIAITTELPLELLPTDACYGPLDDFLKIRGPLVVPSPADDLDIAVDLSQT